MEPSCQSRVQRRRTPGAGEGLILGPDGRACFRPRDQGAPGRRVGGRRTSPGPAGLSRGALARIEQGHGSRVTVATLDRIAAALEPGSSAGSRGMAKALDRLLDAAHAALVERIVRAWSRRGGWSRPRCRSTTSGSRLGRRSRLRSATGVLLVVEAKSVVPDLQAMLADASTGRRDSAPESRSARVDRQVVARPARHRGASNRTAPGGAAFRDVLQRPFRTEDRAVRAWLAAPDPRQPLRGLWFLSSGSRGGRKTSRPASVARRGLSVGRRRVP